MNSCSIRVQVPYQLQRLANCGPEIALSVKHPCSQRGLVDALETAYPALRGAVIDPHTGKRRPLLRFFACQQDHTFLGLDSALPEAVLDGSEPFLIVGAISGG